MPRNIYAIRDTVANDLVGPLWMMRHDQVAIRTFSDIANSKDTQIAQHIDDYELVDLGTIDDDVTIIVPNNRIVITGVAWRAANRGADDQPSLAL